MQHYSQSASAYRRTNRRKTPFVSQQMHIQGSQGVQRLSPQHRHDGCELNRTLTSVMAKQIRTKRKVGPNAASHLRMASTLRRPKGGGRLRGWRRQQRERASSSSNRVAHAVGLLERRECPCGVRPETLNKERAAEPFEVSTAVHPSAALASTRLLMLDHAPHRASKGLRSCTSSSTAHAGSALYLRVL